MPKIFISYRRDDSAGYAQAINGQLVQAFSRDDVFMDVDTMEPGVDFVRAIQRAVGECDVLLALIGKRWEFGDRSDSSRLSDPNDFIRLEVSTALARDIRVIPVLVDGMSMPKEETLPEPLKPLTRRNAIEVSNTRFNFDIERLVGTVRRVLDNLDSDRPDIKNKQRIDEAQNRKALETERRSAVEAKRKEEERVRQEGRNQRNEGANRVGADYGQSRTTQTLNFLRKYGSVIAAVVLTSSFFIYLWPRSPKVQVSESTSKQPVGAASTVPPAERPALPAAKSPDQSPVVARAPDEPAAPASAPLAVTVPEPAEPSVPAAKAAGSALSTLRKEQEPNDQITEPNSIELGTKVQGALATREDRDFYKFQTPEGKWLPGQPLRIRVILRKTSARGFAADLTLYDSSERQLTTKSSSDDQSINFAFDARPATYYYIAVKPPHTPRLLGPSTGPYELEVRQD